SQPAMAQKPEPFYNFSRQPQPYYDIKLPQPKAVSPLIRAARWGFLLTGIIYGYTRFNYLVRKEEREWPQTRAILERRKHEYEASQKMRGEVEMLELAKEAGVKPK
ncbi:hypothetical protein BOX15_Mlig030367g2, partial [Macrostomum lignano]